DAPWREAGEELAVLVEHPGGIGQHDQLLGAQHLGELPGDEIGVDVVGGAVGAGGGRSNHRDEAALLQREDDRGVDRLDLAHLAEVDLAVLLRRQEHLARANQRAVLPGEADRLAAGLVDELDHFLVDLPAEHHLDHVHGLAVGDAHSLDEFALLAQAREHVLDLRPAAVHHDRVHSHQPEQHHVARKAGLERLVGHGIAAELHHDGLAVEALDVRQRLVENARLLGGLRTMVERGVHLNAPFYKQNYWIVICLRCAAAFLGSVSSSTPSLNLASAFASSTSCGSVKLRTTLP